MFVNINAKNGTIDFCCRFILRYDEKRKKETINLHELEVEILTWIPATKFSKKFPVSLFLWKKPKIPVWDPKKYLLINTVNIYTEQKTVLSYQTPVWGFQRPRNPCIVVASKRKNFHLSIYRMIKNWIHYKNIVYDM